MDCLLSTPLDSPDSSPSVGWQRLPMDGAHRSSTSFDSAFDPSRLYSLSFYSDQLALARWKAVNVPGVSEVELQSVWLNHSITLHAYTLKDSDGPHSEHNRHTLFAIQLQPPSKQHAAQQPTQQRPQQRDEYVGSSAEEKECE